MSTQNYIKSRLFMMRNFPAATATVMTSTVMTATTTFSAMMSYAFPLIMGNRRGCMMNASVAA